MKFSPPKKPTLAQEITAKCCDILGSSRPSGAMTIAEWEKAVLIYWIEQGNTDEKTD